MAADAMVAQKPREESEPAKMEYFIKAEILRIG